MKRRMLDFALGCLFCFILIVAVNAYGQSMNHDSVDDIMSVSNPACYVHGVVTVYEHDHEFSFRYLEQIEIEPQYYTWADRCLQFVENQFTDYEIPRLWDFLPDQEVTVLYIYADDNWHVDSVLPQYRVVTGRR